MKERAVFKRYGEKAKGFALAFSFLLFPIAHLKLSAFGLPFYFSEIPILIAAGILLWEMMQEKENWNEAWKANRFFFLGSGLFLLGASVSFFFNEQTFTGLGMLKSFFFLPVLLASILIFTRSKQNAMEKILWLWLAGLVVAAWTSLIIAMNGWLTYDGRLAGFYKSPNYLAMLIAPGMLLAVYFFFTITNKLLKWGLMFFFTILCVTLLLTGSYGAIVSSALSLGLFLWLIRDTLPFSPKKLLLVVCIAILFMGSVLWPTQKFQTLLQNGERSSLVSRQMIWESAWKIILDNPVVGIGAGNFQHEYLAYQKYFSPYLEWAVPQPHNLYLALWLQTGLIGLYGFGMVVSILIWRWYGAWKQKNLSREKRFFGALGLSLLTFYLIYGLIDTPYFKNDLVFALWGVIGMLFVWTKNQSNIVD